MYIHFPYYATSFRLLECKAIFSRDASTRQRPFSENVHLPKVGTVKCVCKSVPQHYSAAAPFSKGPSIKSLWTAAATKRRDDQRRFPTNSLRQIKLDFGKSFPGWRHCGGRKATVLYCHGATVVIVVVIGHRVLSF